jgi:PPOX class probable F420-dependent enzyme
MWPTGGRTGENPTMAHTMSTAEWREFVSSGTRTGKAGVTSADGAPHVTPVWFLLDGDDLVFTTHESSVKHRALRRDARVCVCVDDDTPPYSFVSLWGEATLSEELGELRRWATAIGARYMGADRAGEFGARNAVPGETLVRVRISKVVAVRDMAD